MWRASRSHSSRPGSRSCAGHDPHHHRGPAARAGTRGGARDPLGEEVLRRPEYLLWRQGHGGGVGHERGRIVIPVVWSGTATLATLVFVCRSITFTAPGSTPLLS